MVLFHFSFYQDNVTLGRKALFLQTAYQKNIKNQVVKQMGDEQNVVMQ